MRQDKNVFREPLESAINAIAAHYDKQGINLFAVHAIGENPEQWDHFRAKGRTNPREWRNAQLAAGRPPIRATDPIVPDMPRPQMGAILYFSMPYEPSPKQPDDLGEIVAGIISGTGVEVGNGQPNFLFCNKIPKTKKKDDEL